MRFHVRVPNRPVIIEIKVLSVKRGRNVPRKFAPLQFALIFVKNAGLDPRTAVGVNRVRNVGVQLQTVCAVAVSVLQMTLFVEPLAAVIAEAGAQVIFVAATWAMVGKLARGHGKEEAVVAVDELYVTDDERVVKGERAKGFQTAPALAAKIDAHFCQQHEAPPVQKPG
ncbi:MAG TPA: hypothetical protein VG269_28890 [Tepidisphaeraceae bacterium]|nr:hypothetical protein [Tepidisphaeraceae bacterium]